MCDGQVANLYRLFFIFVIGAIFLRIQVTARKDNKEYESEQNEFFQYFQLLINSILVLPSDDLMQIFP